MFIYRWYRDKMPTICLTKLSFTTHPKPQMGLIINTCDRIVSSSLSTHFVPMIIQLMCLYVWQIYGIDMWLCAVFSRSATMTTIANTNNIPSYKLHTINIHTINFELCIHLTVFILFIVCLFFFKCRHLDSIFLFCYLFASF